jgi:ABC-type nitrate/sulfonate/bicarbonate transport system substrate-binding protein
MTYFQRNPPSRTEARFLLGWLVGDVNRDDRASKRMGQVKSFLKLAKIQAIALLLGLAGCDSKPKGPLTYEEAATKVGKSLPASAYFTNDFLERAKDHLPPIPATAEKVRIAMPWILNDEGAVWYIAVEKGYFQEVGIEAELVPGGPGKDPLALLVGGNVDVGVAPAGAYIPVLMASPTGSAVVAVCTQLKDSPYGWIALDKSTPSDQRSTHQLTPADLTGKSVGLQQGGEVYARFLLGKYHIPPEQVKIVRVGFTTDPLVAGVVDFYAGWVQNQPRFLEQQQHKNWMMLRFKDFGWNEHNDVSVVTKSMTEKKPDLITRYVAAMIKANRFYLDHPEESADITVRYSKDATLDRALVLRRFELERDLVLGHDGKPPLWMSEEVWNNSTTLLLQFGVIDLK